MEGTYGFSKDIGQSWQIVLGPEFNKPYFQQLEEFVAAERQKGEVFPAPEHVFIWTKLCTVDEVKVVILGQDPYHETGQAHGLAFSVPPGIATPRSLSNIYKKLKMDILGFTKPQHGYLLGWAKQGVLLLNAVMTVNAGQANSHKDKGWEMLTNAIISYLNTNRSGLVFILWGNDAKKMEARIDRMKHCVLTGVHPSPLSAQRGYFDGNYFSECNNYLIENEKTPIDWNYLPVQ